MREGEDTYTLGGANETDRFFGWSFVYACPLSTPGGKIHNMLESQFSPGGRLGIDVM